MKLLVIDNYDSFTYNLVHLLRDLGVDDLRVARNDRISLHDASRFDKILLSPGPGVPQEAGIMPELVRALGPEKSILGVCLGHQCIGEVFGATLTNLPRPVHAKALRTKVCDTADPIFSEIPAEFLTGRYHSWVVNAQNFPKELAITAIDEQGEIMALRHIAFRVHGVQFHPESVLTEHGQKLIKNWLTI